MIGRALTAAAMALCLGTASVRAAERTRPAKKNAAPAAAPAAPPAAATEAKPTDAKVEARSDARPDTRAARPAKARVYTFTGLDVEGKLKTPQLLYFLGRVRLELDTTATPKRSFMKELAETADAEGL